MRKKTAVANVELAKAGDTNKCIAGRARDLAREASKAKAAKLKDKKKKLEKKRAAKKRAEARLKKLWMTLMTTPPQGWGPSELELTTARTTGAHLDP